MSNPTPTKINLVTVSMEDLQRMIDTSLRRFREELVRDLRPGDLGKGDDTSSKTESQRKGDEKEQAQKQTAPSSELGRWAVTSLLPTPEKKQNRASDVLEMDFVGYFDPIDEAPRRVVEEGTHQVFTDVQTYIDHLRVLYTNCGITEKHISNRFPRNLRGEALLWWCELSKSQRKRYRRSLEYMLGKMLDRFCMSSTMADTVIRQASWSILDAGRLSIMDFVATIRRAARVKSMGEHEQLLAVWNQLDPFVRLRVERPRSDTRSKLWMEELRGMETEFKCVMEAWKPILEEDFLRPLRDQDKLQRGR
ncbi:hypothetical protein HYFRA_00003940 [Hymenoscyphus fraxineus]|uniref:Uncharacterized protein n=1 Tax=Hymenoscyphus fraxineus TaxID=746836 RepID=A0A9N9L0T0_9HELO|nr:hypothetical protein HYFRA_00003940 [Hymenoscyphus fraxineus]